jgi:hypothetical protein
MSSNLGTVFVELSLDDNTYKQKLGDTLTSTQATAKGIETAWKALGSKSEAMFDSQRLAAENAYTLIKNSAISSTDAIIRAEELKAAKINSINEQQFGTQLSFIEKIKSNWVAASAAIVAAWALINEAAHAMDIGAKALQVKSSFKIMAESSGASAEEVIKNMQRATRGTIDETDLMQKAIKLMTLGYDTEKIERFSAVVVTASKIAGTSVEETYNNLADAIATRLPRTLVRVGAVTREQMQVVNEAIKAGASEWSLYELAMANLELRQKMFQGTQDESTVAMQKFHAEVKETEEALGKGLLRAAQIVYGALQSLGAAALAGYAGLMKLKEGSIDLAAWLAEKGGFKDAAASLRAYANEAKISASIALDAANGLSEKAAKNIGGISEIQEKATKQEIDDARKKVEAQMAALKAIADAKKNDGAITKALMDQAKQAYEDEINMIQNAAKIRTLNGEDSLKVELDVISLRESALTKEYNAQVRIISKSLEDHAVKKEKLLGLDLKYNKEFTELEYKREQTTLDIRNKDLADYTSYLQQKLTLDHMYIDRTRAIQAGELAAEEVALKDSRAHFLITEADYVNQMKSLTLKQSANEKQALDDKFNAFVIEKHKEMDNASLTGEQLNKINDQIRQAYAKHESDMLTLTISTNAKMITLDKEVPKSFSEGWKEGFRQFRDEASNAFNTGKTLATTFTNSVSSGLSKFFDYSDKGFLKMKTLVLGVAHDMYMALVKAFVINPIVSLLTTVIEGLVGSLLTTTVAGVAAAKAQAWGEIPAFTGIAAIEAASAMAGIPIVGPELAAAAFHAMEGLGIEAMELAMAAKGYDVPAGVNPIVQVHEQEMILPAHIANPLRDMLSSGSQRAGGAFTTVHIHGSDTQTMTIGQFKKFVYQLQRDGHNLKAVFA